MQERERRRQLLRAEYGDWSDTIEAELYSQGYPALAVEKEVVPEEEFVMSFLLTQTEMELSLAGDYESITEATKTMALELQQGIIGFDSNEKKVPLFVQSPSNHRRSCFMTYHLRRASRRKAAGLTNIAKPSKGQGAPLFIVVFLVYMTYVHCIQARDGSQCDFDQGPQ